MYCIYTQQKKNDTKELKEAYICAGTRQPSSQKLINANVYLSGDRAEGAEGELDNTPVNNNNSSMSSTRKTFSLEARFSFLNLRRPRLDKNTDNCSQKTESGQTVVLVKGVWGTENS